MVRTQIQISSEQAAGLKRLAAERKTSISELVREGIAAVLRLRAGDDQKARALAAAGKFRSGLTDLSEKHDQYFAKSI